MKNMKKLFAVAMLLGLLGIGKANAAGVFSTTFTAVVVTSATDMELCRVEFSSGTGVGIDSYLLLYDTPTIFGSNVPNQDPVAMGTQWGTGGFGRWTRDNLITPPIIFPSTSIISGANAQVGGAMWGYIDFTDAQGNGRPIRDALVAFKPGVDAGTVVTYVTRKRRTSPEH